MRPISYLSLILALLLAGAARADTADDTLRLWATQQGQWTGQLGVCAASAEPEEDPAIAVYGPIDSQGRLIAKERLTVPQQQMERLKVVSIDADTREILIDYVTAASTQHLRFMPVAAGPGNDTNWITVLEADNGSQTLQNRPVSVRYSRVRNGGSIVDKVEVRFLDEASTYAVRCVVTESMLPPLQ